jgi:hypothetical protein
MGKIASALAIAVTILAAGGFGPVHAACNAIPDAESSNVGVAMVLAAQNPSLPAPILQPGLVGFKGALGRIDRIHLVPSDKPSADASFHVEPDGICVGSKGTPVRTSIPALDPDNLVASLVIDGAAGTVPQLMVLATGAICDQLKPDDHAAPTMPSPEHALIPHCVPLPPLVEPRPDGRPSVRVRLPDGGRLLPSNTAARVTVVLTQAPEVVYRSFVSLLTGIATKGCADMCGGLPDMNAIACVDKLYALTGTDHYDSDDIPCWVGTAAVAKQDFKTQCEDVPTPDGDLAHCDDQPTELKFWTDVCGGVHIPFDWENIAKDKNGVKITRIVGGESGVGRSEKAMGPRLWIPGREFVGSTPYGDPQGTSTGVDWRMPEMDVWYPSGSSESAGLQGFVDQDDSIVHVFPRMRASLKCKGTDEACMGAGTAVRGRGIYCACRDLYAADCECDPLVPARYYACVGGYYDGMPCTRNAHCFPDGKCSGQPTCQATDKQGVWTHGKGHSHGGPDDCWTNDDCTTPAKPWCGYHLFDFGDRNVGNVVTLDAEIVTGGARQRRGTCKLKPGKSCANGAPLQACGAGEGACRGYTLQAQGHP